MSTLFSPAAALPHRLNQLDRERTLAGAVPARLEQAAADVKADDRLAVGGQQFGVAAVATAEIETDAIARVASTNASTSGQAYSRVDAK